MPVYETSTHRARQNAVAQAVIVDGWGYQWRETPQASMRPFDGLAICEGMPSAIVEIKTRDVPSTKYRDMVFSLRKACDLLIEAERTGYPAVIVWAFGDGRTKSIVVNLQFLRYPIEMKGRTDRIGAAADIEPCLLVPVADMKPQPDWIVTEEVA
jgi:hypothetical protein